MGLMLVMADTEPEAIRKSSWDQQARVQGADGGYVIRPSSARHHLNVVAIAT